MKSLAMMPLPYSELAYRMNAYLNSADGSGDGDPVLYGSCFMILDDRVYDLYQLSESGAYRVYPPVIGDFNGDGRDDLCYPVQSGSGIPCMELNFMLNHRDGVRMLYFGGLWCTSIAYLKFIPCDGGVKINDHGRSFFRRACSAREGLNPCSSDFMRKPVRISTRIRE